MTTTQRLAGIQARAEKAKATPGPWIIGVGESVRMRTFDPDLEWLLDLVARYQAVVAASVAMRAAILHASESQSGAIELVTAFGTPEDGIADRWMEAVGRLGEDE